MKTLSSRELREAFLGFFESRQHAVVASSPLVPGNDPTLLFTNAGMVQFKDLFLGDETRDYVRATTSQRCVRAGGKHNDLENVGYTARHLTFFEMLGNFSFGDYFKRDAIQFAWAFVTEALEIAPERLWVTVYNDDDEAADIWINEIGVPADRLSRLGEKDNFWQMGDTGPCGPCSEIFFDHGPDVAGGPPGSPDEDGDRYVEIWNLVFMQFDRDASGTLTPLPKPSVDTGMGLERVSAVLQGVHTIYDTDTFQRLIAAVAGAVGVPVSDAASLRVIADHIRACAFLITDGVLPSNEGRGYVLRRITRRAVRHGYMLGQKQPFFHMLVAPLVDEMGDAYPELAKAAAHAQRVLEQEELRFAQTIEQGMMMLESAIDALDGEQLDGETVFKLYDTYGFPMDLTADIARERQLSVDEAGFNVAMQAQRERAQAASKFGAVTGDSIKSDNVTAFAGYDHVACDSIVAGLFVEGVSVGTISGDQSAVVVLNDTPFYAESGGQVGDTGVLVSGDTSFAVSDTQKGGKAHLHIGTLSQGSLSVGDRVTASIDVAHRDAVRLNHSATHLLHAALRETLGTHVTQKGSLVDAEKLRFDFSHYEAIDGETLSTIETRVNDEIRANHAAQTREMPYDAAVEAGAIALFGEKYESDVRVLKMGDFSMELCGGTHVARTGDIGLFKIRSEAGVASGVRRIEAVTGTGALALVSEREAALNTVSELVRAPREDAVLKIEQMLERNKTLEKTIADLRRQLATGGATDLASQATDVSGVTLLAARIDGADAKSLRDAVDQMRDKLGSRSVVVLGAEDDGKVRLAAGVSKELLNIIKAGDLVRHVAEGVGGKGGGRADFAQAGGTQPENLGKSLASVSNWLQAKLSHQ